VREDTLSSFTECSLPGSGAGGEGGTAGRRLSGAETTAELELRSAINICRQWAAHISARGFPLPDRPPALPSVCPARPGAHVLLLLLSPRRGFPGCEHSRVSMYLKVRARDLRAIAATSPLPPPPPPGARGHVCVTARLLLNVRCKFPLFRLTRSAPTFRRVPG